MQAYNEARNIPSVRFPNWLNEKICTPYVAPFNPLVAHTEQVSDFEDHDLGYEVLDLINP